MGGNMNGDLDAIQVATEIKKRISKEQEFAYKSLRNKCKQAISTMIRLCQYEMRIDVDQQELVGLTEVTEELRELGYRFRFIEVQNENGDLVKMQLLISVEHEKGF